MDFELNEDQQAFRRAARDFAERELAPHAARWDQEGHFPKAQLALAGQLGFCALYTPQPLGGSGLSRLDATLVYEELARVDPSTTAYLSIHNMATWMVARWGRPDLAGQWMPRLASGTALASYCLTEPGAGSDAAALRTTARRTADGWCIDGSKAFISGAGETELLVVMARTGGPQADGISAFAVPADTPGIRYGRREAKMGWNSQPTRAVHFDAVQVGPQHLLGQAGEGFRMAMRGLDGGRLGIAACSVGGAQGALDAACRHLCERRQFGRPLAQFQALQFKLADMATELTAARQMVRLAASRLDRDDPHASVYCAMAKRLATDAGFEVCNQALQLHGGYGYTRDYPLERLLRDLRVHQILEGSNEIMRVIVARHLLEQPDLEHLR